MQGDRRAGPSFSEFNYESTWGQKALKATYAAIMGVSLPVTQPVMMGVNQPVIMGLSQHVNQPMSQLMSQHAIMRASQPLMCISLLVT